jgi:hypothetical protein
VGKRFDTSDCIYKRTAVIFNLWLEIQVVLVWDFMQCNGTIFGYRAKIEKRKTETKERNTRTASDTLSFRGILCITGGLGRLALGVGF